MNLKISKWVLILPLCFGALVAVAQTWEGPSLPPPTGNVDLPLNTGNTNQTKYGELFFPKWTDSSAGGNGYYLDPASNSWLNRLYSWDLRTDTLHDLNTEGVSTGYVLDLGGVSSFYGIDLGGSTKYSWDEVSGGSSLWTANGSNIYYNSGNVGIGTTAPSTKFQVKDGGATFIFKEVPMVFNAEAYVTSASSMYSSLYLGDSTHSQYAGLIYDSSTNALSIRSNNANRMTINSSGNVGIGTANPSHPLYVDAGDDIYVNNAEAGTGELRLGAAWGYPGIYGESATKPLVLGSGTGKIYMNGNVGIGTDSPTQKLDVVGNINATILYDRDDTSYYVDPASTSKFNAINLGGVSRTTWPAGSTSQWTTNGSSIYYNSGNVGVGTSAPTQKIDVVGNISANALYDKDNASYFMDPNGNSSIFRLRVYDIITQTDYNPYGGNPFILSLSSTGQSYLYKLTTQTDLESQGNFISRGTGTIYGNLTVGQTSSSGSDLYISDRIIDSDNSSFYLDPDGYSQLNDLKVYRLSDLDNPSSYYLDLTGNNYLYNVYAYNFYYSSDRSLKKNINKLSNSLEKIKQLEGVSFDWKEVAEGMKKGNIGLIAQDVEKVFPELVTTNDESGLKSVEYANLVAPIIEAIKEQQQQIDQQQKKINELESKIKSLTN
ncbi:MAG: tail fiber domain-containing protein [Patescibacteria group bacterium]